MAGRPRAGKSGRILVGLVNLNLSEWTAEDKMDDLDTTTFENDGYETGTVGIEVLEYGFKGNWDASRNHFDSPPGLYPRDDLAVVKLYEAILDNVFWSVPLSRVLSARNGCVVRQLVTFEASLKSNGVFVRPTGSVA